MSAHDGLDICYVKLFGRWAFPDTARINGFLEKTLQSEQ